MAKTMASTTYDSKFGSLLCDLNEHLSSTYGDYFDLQWYVNIFKDTNLHDFSQINSDPVDQSDLTC